MTVIKRYRNVSGEPEFDDPVCRENTLSSLRRNYHRFFFLLAAALLAVTTVVSAQAAVILQYHHISDDTPVSTSTSPQQFLQHLNLIESEGFSVVPLTQLIEAQRAKTEGDNLSTSFDKQVAITFDDGYLSVFLEAYPLLKSRQWPFTVFVNTEPIDRQSRLHANWNQLREMAENGTTIANHTASHAHLLARFEGETSLQWRQRVSSDIVAAQARIEEETGQTDRLLAYPYGEFDQQLMTLVKHLGFTAFGQHSGPITLPHSAQAIPRFPFGGVYGSASDFQMKLKTLAFPVDRVVLKGIAGIQTDGALLSGDEVNELDLILVEEVPAVSCFGPVALNVEHSESRLRVKITDKLPVGRSRINCTARHSSGRYYWFSQPFFRPNDKGIWLD
ncbi:MAG: polysaccharide deacetylase family protein [Cellvibrionaceae bacterium]